METLYHSMLDYSKLLIGISAVYILAIGFLTGYVADEKNRSGVGWFFLGVFLGISALIAICGLTVRIEEKAPPVEKGKEWK